MLIPNISSWVYGFSIGILLFGFGLMLFGTFPTSFDRSAFPSPREDFSYVSRSPLKGPGYPPVFAYYISGTRGQNAKIVRLLRAVYHPRNRYLLHLDGGASDHERWELALSVEEERTFRAFRNVDVVGKSNALDKKGSSAVAATLHAAALLLKIYKDWDWFITLSASDYPIVTQDDLLHAFTLLPKDLNFIHFYNATDWKEQPDIKQIVVDPNLYVKRNSEIFYATETRDAPDAFRVFRGSSSGFFTRAFMEYCLHGWDNLPRQLLMYFTNVASPLEFYFHTVLCNSDDFRNTTVNDNLRYMVSDIPQQGEQSFSSQSNFTGMEQSSAAFARHFQEDEEVLKKLDEKILKRLPDGLLPGNWCLRPALNHSTENSNLTACYSWGSINTVEPGPRGRRLANFLSKLAGERPSRSKQCGIS
ncbi:hypothetical protein Syun_024814 [Stephania yunnanensis]|uniref:Uncharacterized protein n=1 Tax=Stephania yunnanensis TaxID=152371 RepID=A0AAP0HU54_9MAGN